jgi:hypothetical protein
MLRTLFLVLGMVGALMAFQADTPVSDRLELRLTAFLNPDRSIDCTLWIQNPGKTAIEFSVPSQDPPFMVSVIDRNGRDLNQDAYEPVKRGKSLRRPTKEGLMKIQLNPGEARKFHGRIALPRPSDLQVGTYSVEARLATVDYVGGEYQTSVIHSNKTEIVVKD